METRLDPICHWLDPGLPNVDTRHWVPYMTADELAFAGQKLTLDSDEHSALDEPS